jgi:hypothetical protein
MEQSNPPNVQRPWYKKKRFIIIIAVLIIAIIGSQVDKKKVGSKITAKASIQPDIADKGVKKDADTEDKKTAEQKLTEQLKREIASFDKPFDNSSYAGSIQAIQMELVLFGVWAHIINEGKNSDNSENIKLAQHLQKMVTQRQVKEFARMRKSYAEAAAEKLWESNIYITVSGNNNSIINLTGGLFASNKNIADTQQTLQDILSEFRFKEVRYRWYKGADEFTYYKLETPKDSEPVNYQ